MAAGQLQQQQQQQYCNSTGTHWFSKEAITATAEAAATANYRYSQAATHRSSQGNPFGPSQKPCLLLAFAAAPLQLLRRRM
jgi:hypothetical protein